MRAAIYVRISADPEGRQLGVQRQEEDCRKLARRLKYTVVQVFSDNDISASTKSRKPRPGYAAMLAAVDAGLVDVILAYSTSRLTRRPLELEGLVTRAESGHLSIATVASGSVDLATAAGRVLARILAAIDAGEAETMSERHLRERQQRREQGRANGGGHRAFGFERDGFTPRPHEQELIKAGCAAVLAGRSLASIARDWAKLCPPPTWRPPLVLRWSTSTVRDVLTNPRLIGQLPGGYTARDWEPFVEESTWRGVCAILDDPGRRRERGDTRLLTAIAVCGLCGASVNGGVDRHGRHTYRCSAAKHLDRKAEPVDDYVRDVLVPYLATNRVSAAPGPATGELAGKANGIRARLAELEESAADPSGPSPRMLAAAERRLTAELEQVESEMAAALGTSALAGLPMTEDELGKLWRAADVERRRAIIRACPISITIDPPGRGTHTFRPETVRIVGA